MKSFNSVEGVNVVGASELVSGQNVDDTELRPYDILNCWNGFKERKEQSGNLELSIDCKWNSSLKVIRNRKELSAKQADTGSIKGSVIPDELVVVAVAGVLINVTRHRI